MSTRGQQSAEQFGDNARKLRELERNAKPVKAEGTLAEVIRLRQAVEAAQQSEIDSVEGEAIGRTLFDRMNKMG